jgi:regulatory protein
MVRTPPQADDSDIEVWHEAALAYLGRFASSAENLRRVLRRRALREARKAGGAPDWPAIEPIIEAVLARLVRAGLIDDAGYAGQRVDSLTRRGEPARRIRARLTAKGVAREAIDGALDDLRSRDPDADFRAACRFVLRRRLGPCRPQARRVAERARDLAALGRAGFDYATAKRALELPDEAAVRAALEDEGRR